MCFTAPKKIHVWVKCSTGKTLGISDFTPNSAILELKQRIEEKEGIPLDKQLLLHDGRELANQGATFTEYGIDNDAVINLSVSQGSMLNKTIMCKTG